MVGVELTAEVPYLYWIRDFLRIYVKEEIMQCDKPFKTYDELIELMENRNIIIENKQDTIRKLQNHSYYKIVNGFKNTFLKDEENEQFLDGTTFNDLYNLNIIDKSLNYILLKYLLYFENSFKNRLSYIISENFGVYSPTYSQKIEFEKMKNDLNNKDDYLCKENYSKSHNFRFNVLLGIKKTLSQDVNTPSILHYKDEKNHIPPWVLMNCLSLGQVIKWYSILKKEEKNELCRSFNCLSKVDEEQSKLFFKKSIDLIREYRNMIAHGQRTFYRTNLPELPSEILLPLVNGAISRQEVNSKYGINDTFAIILVLTLYIDDEVILTKFHEELLLWMNDYKDMKFVEKSIFDIFKLPLDFEERMNTLYDYRIAKLHEGFNKD